MAEKIIILCFLVAIMAIQICVYRILKSVCNKISVEIDKRDKARQLYREMNKALHNAPPLKTKKQPLKQTEESARAGVYIVHGGI